jgi:hypothetical protein
MLVSRSLRAVALAALPVLACAHPSAPATAPGPAGSLSSTEKAIAQAVDANQEAALESHDQFVHIYSRTMNHALVR